MTERWLPISGYPYYEVSDLGRVRNLDRFLLCGNGVVRYHRGRVLTASPASAAAKGGARVGLHLNGLQKNKIVARLVLEAFVGPCPPGMEAYHKGDPGDDGLVNLEWRTPVGQRGGSRIGRRTSRRLPLRLTLAGWWAAERASHTVVAQLRDPDPRWRLTEAGLAALNTPPGAA